MFTVLNFCVFAFMLCVSCAQTLSRVRLFATPWTVSLQAPLSMGFPSPEYWSGLPFPSPGDLPSPGIKPAFLTSPALAGRFFTTSGTWETLMSEVSVLQDEESSGFTAMYIYITLLNCTLKNGKEVNSTLCILLQLKILNVTKDISIAEGIQRLDFFYIYIAIGYVKMGQSLWKTI